MLFAFEQITIASTTTKLTENTYTISNQHADYALFSLSGGNITVRYDGSSASGGTLLVARDALYRLDNREMIEGFRAESVSGTPAINIQYVMLEWSDMRRIFVPKVKPTLSRSAKTITQVIELGTGASQRRRVQNRPLHEFNFDTFYIRGLYGEQDMHGFFMHHQGDIPFLLHANKFSNVEYPQLVGYGDGNTEQFFLPARFIMPNTLIVYFDGMVVDCYSINEASGLLSFYTAPPVNVVITATYSRYYKCLFSGDKFDEVMLGDLKGNSTRTFIAMEVIP